MPRKALQLATRMALEDMVDACADIDAAGYWSVECWGGATFDACIRFLNEDPWERLRTFRQLLPNSRLLAYAGWGHTAYRRSACATRFVSAYLLTLALPPEGQVCPANPNPFQPRLTRQSRRAPLLVGLPPVWMAR